MSRQTKSSLVYIIVLFLGGICHTMDVIIHRADDLFTSTWMFCADLFLYSGLILYWMQSVRRRLLPSRGRSYMLNSGGLMVLFLIIRTVKYRIVQWSTPMERYCWYIYYVPIILIPTLFLMSSFDFRNSPEQHSRIKRYPLILGLVLACGIMTNDLHHLAFLPNPDTTVFYGKSGTYTHGVLFYAAYFWAGAMITAAIIHLIVISRRMKNWKHAIRPFLCMLLIPLLITVNKILGAAKLPQPFLAPEVLIFCMIGVQEYCIRNRLLPHNENYADFFARTELPVSITDKELSPVYRTAIPVTAEPEQMRQAVGSFVYPDPDTRLSGMELQGGYAFFAEDETVLHRLNEELADANEILSMENELLAHEQELIQEKAAIEERNRLYDKAAQAIYPTQKRIAAILDTMQPNTPSFRQDMSKVLFMTAFIKRQANFVMLGADRDTISAAELASALKESNHYLRYGGIESIANIMTEKDFPCRTAMTVYECFEAAAEALFGKTAELWLRMLDRELVLLADTEQPVSLPELPLPVTCTHEDGQTVIRIPMGGDAA